jgi:poly-gamma-glutamate capsule biosynthesis protein CapA/YwtB (metallophosphatase superfamily)
MYLKKQRKQGKLIISIGLAVFLSVLAGAVPSQSAAASDKMTLVALGDCIISNKFSVQKDLGFLKVVDLVRSADCAWANCELPIADTSHAYPEYREMDLNGAGEPWVADELKWLGVDFVGFANNHTMDYGHEGMFATIANLKRVGIGYAGAGKDLEEAGRPRYVDTAGGRIGQVSCASTYHPGTFASRPHPYVNGRPGLNPLRVQDTIQLKTESYEAMRKISNQIDALFEEAEGETQNDEDKKKNKESVPDKKPEKELKIRDIKFVPGEEADFYSTMNEKDLERIIRSVKIARRNARIVIVSIHEHRSAKRGKSPAKFLETFARTCIDAGADAVFNTGPHQVWGIEIYKNKPIFYSLGNFFFQITTEQFPSETFTLVGLDEDTRDASLLKEIVNKGYFNKKHFWESFVPLITFENGNQVTDIKLYPILLGKDKPIYAQGTPVMAGKEEARAIIAGLATLSEPYKTKIEFRDGVGVVQLK